MQYYILPKITTYYNKFFGANAPYSSLSAQPLHPALELYKCYQELLEEMESRGVIKKHHHMQSMPRRYCIINNITMLFEFCQNEQGDLYNYNAKNAAYYDTDYFYQITDLATFRSVMKNELQRKLSNRTFRTENNELIFFNHGSGYSTMHSSIMHIPLIYKHCNINGNEIDDKAVISIIKNFFTTKTEKNIMFAYNKEHIFILYKNQGSNYIIDNGGINTIAELRTMFTKLHPIKYHYIQCAEPTIPTQHIINETVYQQDDDDCLNYCSYTASAVAWLLSTALEKGQPLQYEDLNKWKTNFERRDAFQEMCSDPQYRNIIEYVNILQRRKGSLPQLLPLQEEDMFFQK
jgi:hypothetical protein